MEKAAEAELFLKKAKKCHTRTLTKWTPEWDEAATNYERAAQIFTHINSAPGAKDAWLAASNAHKEAGNLFNAAKALETLATFLKDQPSPDSAFLIKLYVDASKLYALDSKPERQAEALAKAARLSGPGEGKAQTAMVLEGLTALEDAERWHLTPDLFRSVILMQLRSGLYMDAIATLKRQNRALSHLESAAAAAKCGLEIVVIALGPLNDWVLADREFKALSQTAYGFPHSKEQAVACDLLSAIEERSNERLSAVLKEQCFTFLIAEVSRMAKKIAIAADAAAAGASSRQGAQSPASPAAPAGSVAAVRAAKKQVEDDEDIK